MTDYASADAVFAAIEALEADVAGRLRAVLQARPTAAAFVASAEERRRRHVDERARLRRRLRVAAPPAGAARAEAAAPDLRGLREAQQALVYAHAEGLPALGDSRAVDVLATHMVALAGQLTVIDLWLEAEEGGA
jgi:hypothetical protein